MAPKSVDRSLGVGCDRPAASALSAREAELLSVTLRLLQEHGYERLTLDAIANNAHASKATVYRRWSSKAELVLAAFNEGVCDAAVAPDTGTLRGDLLQLGNVICEHAWAHAGTIRAILGEVSRNPMLNDAMQEHFLRQRHMSIGRILQQAVDRDEIPDAAIDKELWDLLPGYLIFRSIVSGRRPAPSTVQVLVDNVIIPSLMRVRTNRPFDHHTE